jgi:hypothetical protein
LDKDDYKLSINTDKDALKLEFGRSNPAYTITEALKVFEIVANNQLYTKSVNYWKAVEESFVIPKRSAESLRNFYKSHAH